MTLNDRYALMLQFALYAVRQASSSQLFMWESELVKTDLYTVSHKNRDTVIFPITQTNIDIFS